MDSVQPSRLYDSYYYAHGCGREYKRDHEWLKFFGTIADRIISDLNPGTVLDAGCALGLLVESLWRRNIEAYGIDISEYAIQNVHPEIRPYCWTGSILEPFPRKYDLIVSIEVLEHLLPEQADLAVSNLCRHSDDILFSSSPLDYKEITHFNVQSPEYWAELFARHGFFRDVDFDASFITPWAVRFRKTHEPITRVILPYERRLWHLLQDNEATRQLNLEQRRELAEKDQVIRDLRLQLEQTQKRWQHLEKSLGWVVMLRLQKLRAWIAPMHSVRDQAMEGVLHALRTRSWQDFRRALSPVGLDISRRMKRLWWNSKLRLTPLQDRVMSVDAIKNRPPARPHRASVDIVICVHNALCDTQSCLKSVFEYTPLPYSLILVDDGSDVETRDYLSAYAQEYGATLIRNETAKGYTLAANQGLHYSTADYVVLLNSDTIVTESWIDHLIACAESDLKIGVVGPLSNTASWQSIPHVETADGDWATNPLPEGISILEMGQLVNRFSGRLYPTMPLLNGFCLLIKRAVIDDIGYFDEDCFGPGYGEEDDYVLRARKAGWQAALADDVYIYHAQSRSYSNEKRLHLSSRSSAVLLEKHGRQLVLDGVNFCRHNRVLEGIRARNQILFDRELLINSGKKYAGRRVLFVLPVTEPGGGANVIIDEALAMRAMGVDVSIFNKTGFQGSFEAAYPALQVPVVYGEPESLGALAGEYDAVVASVYFTVEWLNFTRRGDANTVLGYYVQGFEPYIYEPDTDKFKQALDSYTLISGLRLFAKTMWTCEEVQKHTGAECALVGPSLNIALFRPRPRLDLDWPDRPLRIAAMIRPSTLYRAPKLTMEVLRRVSKKYNGSVEIVIFGISLEDPEFGALPHDFPWTLGGVLTQKQVARLFNEIDIFVDFSSHQAMGLTALEAMACGVAVIVPEYGGAFSFARHEDNSLVVDTNSPEACEQALCRLVEDDALRAHLQSTALRDAVAFYPERPALKILEILFDELPYETH
jgi:GT2 family glycosyltransferase/SAM-dependent methyltransferase